MKTKLISIVLICSLLSFLIFSCEKDEIIKPGLVIYKTNADYLDNVCIGMHPDGTIWRVPGYGYSASGDRPCVINADDSTYLFRIRLLDGYVLAEESYRYGHDVFLSMTILDYIRIQDKYHITSPSQDTLRKYILDTEPFVEYYYDENDPRKFELSDTARINEIIRNGELEKYFNREK